MMRGNWVAKCPCCGAKTYGSPYMTIDEAKAWAAEWDKGHREVCGEREAGSQEEA